MGRKNKFYMQIGEYVYILIIKFGKVYIFNAGSYQYNKYRLIAEALL